MRVITYGTFDLFHEGHRRLLERAKALGDYLIVAVTTENFDEARGKLNVQQPLMERIKAVQDSGLADEVIIEEHQGQKITDIQKHAVDIFAVGSDWIGHFDYLRDWCEVVYLERTKGVSSTERRNESAGIVGIGLIGTGRIAHRFVDEARYVSGIDVVGAWSPRAESVRSFVDTHELALGAGSLEDLLAACDAVYIATPHGTHVDLALQAIAAGKHVLCEKPMALSAADVTRIHEAADAAGVVVLEAIKTAFAPAFERMVAVARSGSIGKIRAVDGTFTKLVEPGLREHDPVDGGSIAELATYPLLAIVKLLGTDDLELRAASFVPDEGGADQFSRIDLRFGHAIASATVGIGVKSEGDLVVSGTRGYLYVPAPWWKTEYFEARFENPAENEKYFVKFNGDGLRYEIAEFSSLIRRGEAETYRLRRSESVWIADVIERARQMSVRFA